MVSLDVLSRDTRVYAMRLVAVCFLLVALTSTAVADEKVNEFYDMDFQSGMDSLNVGITFHIYVMNLDSPMNLGGVPIPADTDSDVTTIRGFYDSAGDQDNFTDQFEWVFETEMNSIISTAFPGDEVVPLDPEVDPLTLTSAGNTALDPIVMTASTTVTFSAGSFNFDEVSEDFDLSDVILGILQLGATVEKGITFKSPAYHQATFNLSVPADLGIVDKLTTPEPDPGVNGDDQVVQTIVGTTDPGDPGYGTDLEETVAVLIFDDNPTPTPTGTEIEVITTFDIESFDTLGGKAGMDLDTSIIINYIDVSSPDYADLLPGEIDIDALNSDGIRLILQNGLIDKDEIINNSFGDTDDAIAGDMANLTGSNVTISTQWNDASLNQAYIIHSMAGTVPVEAEVAAVDISFSAASFGIDTEGQTASVHDIIVGALKLGASAEKEISLTFEADRPTTYNIIFPTGIVVEPGSPGARYVYTTEATWPSKHIQTVALLFSHETPIPTPDGSNVLASSTMDIMEFDFRGSNRGIRFNTEVQIDTISLEDYPTINDQIPSSITPGSLTHITGDGLRLFYQNGLVNESTLTDEIDTKADIPGTLQSIFNSEVGNTQTEFDDSTDDPYDLNTMVGEPFIIHTNASNLEFGPESFDLNSSTNQVSIHDIIEGILRMNASVVKDFEVDQKEGVALQFTILGPDGFQIGEGTPRDPDRVGEGRRWSRTYNISQGTEKETLSLWMSWDTDWPGGSASLREVFTDGQNVIINATIDMEQFDMIDLTVAAEILAIKLSDYGLDSQIPETNVKNLTTVSASFIRLLIDNGIVDLADLEGEIDIKDDLMSQFNAEESESTWVDNEGYVLSDLGRSETRSLKLLISSENIPLSPGEFGLDDNITELHNLAMGLLKMGAELDQEFEFTIPKTTQFRLNIRFPMGVEISGAALIGTVPANIPQGKVDGPTTYTVVEDDDEGIERRENRELRLEVDTSGVVDGMGELTDVTTTLEITIRAVTNVSLIRDIMNGVDVDANIDLSRINETKQAQLQITVSINWINLSDAGNIDIPDQIHNFEFISAEFIQVAVDSGYMTLEEIFEEIDAAIDDMEGNLSSALDSSIELTPADTAQETFDGRFDTEFSPIYRIYSGQLEGFFEFLLLPIYIA